MDLQKKKVAVIGALNVDIGAWPEGPLARGDSIPGRVRSSLGGVGWNIARNCALLGAETAFFSLLGRDEQEEAIRSAGVRFGVALDGCQWTDGANNRYLYVCDESGDVAAAVNDMGLCGRMDAGFAGAILPALEGFDAVVLDANLPAETLAFLARRVEIPLVVDCVSAAKCARLRPALPFVHTLKANLVEAEALTGETGPETCARALLAAGVKRAVISLGADGMLCAEGDRVFRQPSAAEELVDATGAGDALTAALAVGLAKGLPLEECAALGAAAAAITLSHPGSVTEALSALAQ